MDGPDESRFTRLYQAHADAVHRYAAQRVGWQEAPEIVSDTFTVAWRKLHRIPADAEKPWLLGVARLETLRRHRGTARRVTLYEQVLTTSNGENAVGDIADGVAASIDVRQALATLSESDRDLLLTTLWTDLTPADAARVLGCSRAAYAVRLHRARRRFERAYAVTRPDLFPSPALRSV